MAYVTIPQLPGGSALTGLEQFEAVQSSTSVKLTGTQLKTFMSSAPSFTVDDAVNTGVSSVISLLHTTSGTPGVGIGASLTFAAETQVAVNTNLATISAVTTNVGSGTEAADVAINTVAAGAISEVGRFTSTKRLGVGTTTPTSPIHGLIDDTVNTGVSTVLTAAHTTSLTPNVGIGAGLMFQVESSIGVTKSGAQIAGVVSSTSVGAENFDLVIQLMTAGAAVAEVARFTSTKRLGINTATPSTALEAVNEDATTSTVVAAARITRATSGTPAAGIGTALEWATETAVGTNKVSGAIYTQSSSLTVGAENFDLAIGVMSSGVATVEVVRVTSTSRVGINTTAPAVSLQAVTTDTVLNATTTVARLTHTVTGTAAIGIGAALDFEVENAVGTNRVGSVISSEITTITNGSENFDLVFRTMTSGAAATEKFRIGSAVITPTVQFSQFGAGTAPVATSYIRAGSSSLTISPISFDTTSPTLLTTAPNGGFDYNGQALYFTPQNNERGVVATRQTYVNTAGTRAGPNAINSAQTATFTAASSTITLSGGGALAPGSATGNTGALVFFTTTGTLPPGLSTGVPYWVNWVATASISVSLTQGGTPLTFASIGSGVQSAVFYFPILGNGLTSVGLNLAANTRYFYDLFFTLSHTGTTPAGTSISYALTNFTGTLAAHGYRVTSQGSTAAISGNLTGVANTSSSLVSNYITSGFANFQTVTGLTAATANTTNLVQIQGQIDTVSACTYVMPTISFPVAPAASAGSSIIYQGAYMSIYPVGPVATNTSIGGWVT